MVPEKRQKLSRKLDPFFDTLLCLVVLNAGTPFASIKLPSPNVYSPTSGLLSIVV